jgi:hypothetical protein
MKNLSKKMYQLKFQIYETIYLKIKYKFDTQYYDSKDN